MTKILTAAALVIALSTSAIAAPTYGFSVGTGQVNPFSAEDGR